MRDHATQKQTFPTAVRKVKHCLCIAMPIGTHTPFSPTAR